MSSLSLSRIPRPYQFALLAVLIVAVLWFAVLHNMVSSSSSESTQTTPPPPTSVHSAHRAALPPASVHHPASETAKGAAHTAPSVTATHRAAGTTRHAATATATHASAAHAATRAGTAAKTKTPPAPGASSHTTIVKEIESQLHENKVVMALFWDPKASLDQFVRGQLKIVGQVSSGTLAVHYAEAKQVAEFGPYTQKVLINETPTILIIKPGGATSTLTGFNDVRSIDQAIAEAANPFASVSEDALTSYRQSVARVCAPVESRFRSLASAFSSTSSPQTVEHTVQRVFAEEAQLIATIRKLPTPAGTDAVLFQKDVRAAEHLFTQLRGIFTRLLTDVRARNTSAAIADLKQLSHVSGGGYEVVAAICPSA